MDAALNAMAVVLVAAQSAYVIHQALRILALRVAFLCAVALLHTGEERTKREAAAMSLRGCMPRFLWRFYGLEVA